VDLREGTPGVEVGGHDLKEKNDINPKASLAGSENAVAPMAGTAIGVAGGPASWGIALPSRPQGEASQSPTASRPSRHRRGGSCMEEGEESGGLAKVGLDEKQKKRGGGGGLERVEKN